MHFSTYYGTDYLVFASKFILSGAVQTYPFSLKTQKFFFSPFFKNCLSTRRVFASFLSVQMCPFPFESAKAFSVFDNFSVHTWRFWYCDIIVFKKFRFQESTRKHENSAITGEPISSEKFHFCIILRYFDQGCLSFVIIWLHSFADGNSSKVVTGWQKYRNPQSRNWKIVKQ